jgi:hypothetical protein
MPGRRPPQLGPCFPTCTSARLTSRSATFPSSSLTSASLGIPLPILRPPQYLRLFPLGRSQPSTTTLPRSCLNHWHRQGPTFALTSSVTPLVCRRRVPSRSLCGCKASPRRRVILATLRRLIGWRRDTVPTDTHKSARFPQQLASGKPLRRRYPLLPPPPTRGSSPQPAPTPPPRPRSPQLPTAAWIPTTTSCPTSLVRTTCSPMTATTTCLATKVCVSNRP